MTSDAETREGWIAPEVASEFPDLRLITLDVEAVPRKSPREVKERLRRLSDRFHGSHAVMMRQQPIPWAYRVFFRHIGLDPDADRTPVEAVALERLLRGGFKSRNLVDDALTIAVVETGVPVWALDTERIGQDLGIRQAADREPLGRGEEPSWLPAGRLTVVDELGPIAVLFGDIAPAHGVSMQTRRMTLFSVQVAGVPSIHVEEALWLAGEILAQEEVAG